MPFRSAFRAAPALAALAVAVPAAPATAQDRPVAFTDVTVVPMDRERRVPGQTVVVENGRITALGPAGSVTVPGNAVRVNGRGKFLMPGLSEMHAHVPPQQAVTDEQLRDIMFLYVANGVTTIRGMLGAPYQLQLRERLARGEMLGPTFHVGAPSLNGNAAPTPDTAAALVRAHKAAGYDFLKLHPGLTRPVYDAIVRTSREVGITYAGHVSADVGLEHTLASRQGSIDHLDGYLEATLPAPLLARVKSETDTVRFVEIIEGADASKLPDLARRTRDAGVWNVPTMALWEAFFSPVTVEELARRPELVYASRQAVEGWSNQKRNQVQGNAAEGVTPEVAARFLDFRLKVVKALADAGAPLLLGTDSPQLFSVPGFSLHREMQVMRRAGLTPWQILQSGTANVARYVRESLGKADEAAFGTVAVGQRADLILVDADPLADVANVAKRSGVMVKGRWIPESEIQAGLKELAARKAKG